ncbi:protein translocase SEC61 complex subunit gamma [Candidatus Woesearchaeota archaeon]|nr:protein translocase SEC61 complex subunit gamma [Candidatus Woesearchaeota archaeon]
MKFKDIIQKLKSFLIECKRVWQVTRKPSKSEFTVIMKVTGIGMIVIGLVGFIINFIWQVFLA